MMRNRTREGKRAQHRDGNEKTQRRALPFNQQHLTPSSPSSSSRAEKPERKQKERNRRNRGSIT
jgi:hypothetical protein